MERAEQVGLGVAIGGHALLFGALSLGLLTTPKPVVPPTPPVDIQFVDEVGLRDQVPNPSPAEPAPSVAPEVGPPIETPAPPVIAPMPAPLPTPAPRPIPAARPTPAPPKPTPKPVAVPRPAPAKPAAKPAKPANAKPTIARTAEAQAPRGSRLGADFLRGVTDRPSVGTAQSPRAAAGPAVEAGLVREITRQLKPHWKAPTGADAEALRTTLSIALNRDGTVASVRVLDTSGQTPSNRGQVRLHQEAAVKAVRLAAPFVLPAELYDAWKVLEPVGFDKRLG